LCTARSFFSALAAGLPKSCSESLDLIADGFFAARRPGMSQMFLRMDSVSPKVSFMENARAADATRRAELSACFVDLRNPWAFYELLKRIKSNNFMKYAHVKGNS